jgi:prevent-host-death family protein
MDKTISVAEAKNKLPSIIHEVEQGVTVKITRHGKPVAIVISQHVYEQTTDKGQDFWESLGKFRNLLSSEGIIFSKNDFLDLRDTTPGRSCAWSK